MSCVLVIDDDRQIRALIRQMLERDGHRVVEVEDGTHGLEALRQDVPDLVVIDIYMPGPNGWETIQAMQAVAPGLPFILISGGGALEPLQPGSIGTLASLRGKARFQVLRKPFAWSKFRRAVTEVLTMTDDAAIAGAQR